VDTVLGGAAVFSDSGAARLSELVGSSDVVAAAVCGIGASGAAINRFVMDKTVVMGAVIMLYA